MSSLRDVARLAGCAVSTASCALSGRGVVAAATVEKVHAAAAELAYQPDPLRAQLAAGRFRARRQALPIAFLRWGRRVTLYQRYLERLLPEHGYACQVVDCPDDSEPARVAVALRARGITGLIIHRRAAYRLPHFCTADWSGLAVLVAGTVDADCPYTSHDIGIFEQWRLAWRIAIAAGYERIGAICLTDGATRHEDALRLAACRSMQQTLPRGQARLRPYRDAFRYDRQRLLAWCEEQRPEVLISSQPTVQGHLPGLPLLGAGGNLVPGSRRIAHVGPSDEQRVREAIAIIDRLLRERAFGPLEHPQRLTLSSSLHPGNSFPLAGAPTAALLGQGRSPASMRSWMPL